MSDLSHILVRAGQGDSSAADELMALVYDELKRMAARQMANQRPGQTLTPTGLVHEAFLRMAKGGDIGVWNNRGHFFCAAGEAMRRILIESARRKRAAKRGEGWERVPLDATSVPENGPDDRLLALDEALEKLSREKPKVAELVKLRYFAGLTIAEACSILEISPRTAKSWWAFAKARLQADIGAVDDA